jgi:hypothetical protein
MRVKGLFDVITQTVAGKWSLSLEMPAQNQSAACTALEPAIQPSPPARTMTMRVVKKCSARAARKIVLSAIPQAATSATTGTMCVMATAGATSARPSATSSAP